MTNLQYKQGTSFHEVYRIYEFDRKLRNLILSIVEEIELMLRTQLSYYHAHKYGPLGYTNEKNYIRRHNHERFMKIINDSIDKNKKQSFVSHHINEYDGNFPIWVIVELFTTGELSFFYSDMLRSDRKAIAKSNFFTSETNVSSWLLCLTTLRNYCAHYSRLYYNWLPAIPATPTGFSYTLDRFVFDYILVLKFLYFDPIKWKNVILPNICALIEEYSGVIKLEHIGFPDEWEKFLLESNPKINS